MSALVAGSCGGSVAAAAEGDRASSQGHLYSRVSFVRRPVRMLIHWCGSCVDHLAGLPVAARSAAFLVRGAALREEVTISAAVVRVSRRAQQLVFDTSSQTFVITVGRTYTQRSCADRVSDGAGRAGMAGTGSPLAEKAVLEGCPRRPARAPTCLSHLALAQHSRTGSRRESTSAVHTISDFTLESRSTAV
ncbi:hypothetical protein [Streptomyces sp. NRRL WC-3618]|uniref:hypothetical protein n=1 Tax=Streptomyces sp. NRRL WC-3618 TaxID=1519490 RepID=UPI0006AE22CA|nr:hypothetical protein [Streptomyces sp. NRRL WC-3618]